MKKIVAVLSVILYSLLISFCSTTLSADLVILGGKIITVDKDFSIAEAIAVQDDKITFVGSNSDVKSYIDKDTKIIELNDELVLPGLIDAHGHLTGYGKSLESIDLVGTKSYDVVLKIVSEKISISGPDEWIQGRGWDQNDWDIKKFPNASKIK